MATVDGWLVHTLLWMNPCWPSRVQWTKTLTQYKRHLKINEPVTVLSRSLLRESPTSPLLYIWQLQLNRWSIQLSGNLGYRVKWWHLIKATIVCEVLRFAAIQTQLPLTLMEFHCRDGKKERKKERKKEVLCHLRKLLKNWILYHFVSSPLSWGGFERNRGMNSS